MSDSLQYVVSRINFSNRIPGLQHLLDPAEWVTSVVGFDTLSRSELYAEIKQVRARCREGDVADITSGLEQIAIISLEVAGRPDLFSQEYPDMLRDVMVHEILSQVTFHFGYATNDPRYLRAGKVLAERNIDMLHNIEEARHERAMQIEKLAKLHWLNKEYGQASSRFYQAARQYHKSMGSINEEDRQYGKVLSTYLHALDTAAKSGDFNAMKSLYHRREEFRFGVRTIADNFYQRAMQYIEGLSDSAATLGVMMLAEAGKKYIWLANRPVPAQREYDLSAARDCFEIAIDTIKRRNLKSEERYVPGYMRHIGCIEQLMGNLEPVIS